MFLIRSGRLPFSSAIQIGKNLKVKKDNYKAVHLTPLAPLSNSSFQQYMTTLLSQSSTNATSSIWVHLAKDNLSLISDLVNQNGFKMHHSKGQEMSLYKWVREGKQDLVPAFLTHIIGCGGVIIRDDKIMLVEKKSGALKGKFGIPGGRADPSQCIQKCTQREVFEQVGLKTTFKRILWLRELSAYVYGSFDMYYACLMTLEEEQINKLKQCEDEIASIVWVHLKDLEQFMVKNSVGTQQQMAKYMALLYKNGYDFKAEGTYFKEQIYESPIDHKKRWFGQHFLA